MAERVQNNKDKECYSAGVFLVLKAWMQKKTSNKTTYFRTKMQMYQYFLRFLFHHQQLEQENPF